MPPEGLDDAREAFAQEIAPASKPRDQAGRFVQSSSKPEPIFQPREVEGDDRGDAADGGADPRLVEQERRVADGWSEERDAGRPRRPEDRAQERDHAGPDAEHRSADAKREKPDGAEADDAGQDDEGPDEGAAPEGDAGQDAGPRYKIEVDGEEREVSLDEALKGYVSGETFNRRMGQMAEVAKAIDHRAAEAVQARDAYIEMCRRQEQEFAALIPPEPTNWDELYRQNPAAAHQLEQNYKAVYGTLSTIRARRAQAEQHEYRERAERTEQYSKTEFQRFCQRNKLSDQGKVDKALADMRRTLLAHGFREDEIGTTYDERMLSVALKAARYDNMMANRPVPVQPERPLRPGSAPRVGGGQERSMNDAQRRLAASGRVDDAAAVMAQLIRR